MELVILKYTELEVAGGNGVYNGGECRAVGKGDKYGEGFRPEGMQQQFGVWGQKWVM
jgi:hypothetical protein